MFGILNIRKPSGLTSRDCVNRIQRLVRPEKVGHSGTLDPMADGVLIVPVGQAVRLVDWLHQLPKTYVGTFQLGVRSPSCDTESIVESLPDPPVPPREAIQSVLGEFLGTITQVPPIYSAVRIDGKRAYQRARAGENIAMPSRSIEIHRLEVLEYTYPRLRMEIECGTGTYIRSLGRDLARRLGSDAIMTELTRTAIGTLTLDDSTPLEMFDTRDAVSRHLKNPVSCLSMLPQVTLASVEIERLAQGKAIEIPEIECDSVRKEATHIAAIDPWGNLRSILRRNDSLSWRPHRNFIEDKV